MKNKSFFSKFLLLIAIVIIVFLLYYIYELKIKQFNEIHDLQSVLLEYQSLIENLEKQVNTTTSASKLIEPNVGEYSINGTPVDPGDGDGIMSITLYDNNQFKIDLVYAASYTGNYNISNDTLICSATTKSLYEGGDSSNSTNLNFKFKILSTKEIEFLNTDNNSSDFELNKGISYSIK